MQIINTEFYKEQRYATSLVLGTKAPLLAASVIGKWVVMVRIDGFIGVGVGATKELATQAGAKEANDLKNNN